FNTGGLGIDLGGNGVTPGDPLDADVGPNRLQNFPLIEGPVTAPRVLINIRFTLDAEPNRQYTVELLSTPAPDASGHGEGRTPLGTTTVQTDAGGHAEGGVSVRVDRGIWLTATATGPGGTSEF